MRRAEAAVRATRPIRRGYMGLKWVMLAVALTAACTPTTDPDGAGPREGSGDSTTVRVSQGSDLLSLDPYYKLESPSFSIQRNIFDPLTDFDENIKLEPALAESWELIEPTEWRFNLRRGVSFHEGQPFTAADAVFSLRRALDWPQSRVSSEIQTVDQVEAIDDYTLRITTRIPDAILPLRLASILILDRESVEPAIQEHGDAWLATHANGTGPYRVEEWRKDERCALVAHRQHWGGRPQVERLEFIPTSNDSTRMTAFQQGQYDIMVNVPPRFVETASAQRGFTIIKQPSLRLIYLGLDVGRDQTPGIEGSPPNPLKDSRVRRAMALAIDNRLIVQTIMGGNAAPADQLMPEGVVGHDPGITLSRPNRDAARQLLSEAGYGDGFKVRLDGPNDRYVNDAQIMQAVATQLAQVGIEVQVTAVPKARFFSMEEQAECSFFLIGWANTNGDGSHTFDHLLHTADPERNLGVANSSTNYSNPQLDELTEEASREFDPAERELLLQQAHRLAMEDLPHIPLHFQMDIYAVSDRLEWRPRRDTEVRGIDIRLRDPAQ